MHNTKGYVYFTNRHLYFLDLIYKVNIVILMFGSKRSLRLKKNKSVRHYFQSFVKIPENVKNNLTKRNTSTFIHIKVR